MSSASNNNVDNIEDTKTKNALGNSNNQNNNTDNSKEEFTKIIKEAKVVLLMRMCIALTMERCKQIIITARWFQVVRLGLTIKKARFAEKPMYLLYRSN